MEVTKIIRFIETLYFFDIISKSSVPSSLHVNHKAFEEALRSTYSGQGKCYMFPAKGIAKIAFISVLGDIELKVSPVPLPS